MLQLQMPEQKPLLLALLQQLAAAIAAAQQNGDPLPQQLLQASWAAFEAHKDFVLAAPMMPFLNGSVLLLL